MTANQWFGLGMLAGAVVGAGIALVYHRNKISQVYEEVDQEMEDYRRVLREKMGAPVEIKVSDPEAVKASIHDALVKPAAANLVRDFASRRPDLSAGEMTRNEYVEVVEELPDKDIPKLPRVITIDEWSNGEGFTDATLEYYEDDDVLIDEDGEIVVDPEELVGDALCHFGESTDKKDVAIVRNFDTMCDYEILRIHGSFADMHGIK